LIKFNRQRGFTWYFQLLADEKPFGFAGQNCTGASQACQEDRSKKAGFISNPAF
jgi:hypothetical protein